MMKLHLEITGRCNLSCVHCYNSGYNIKRLIKRELEHDSWLKIIKEANVLGCERFSISGGEPLLYQNGKIDLLLELIENCAAPVILFTNSHLLDKVKFEKLQASEKLFAIRISLDGLKSHNKFRPGSAYKEIIGRMLAIRKNSRLRLSVTTMLNRNNLEEMISLYRILKSIKVDRWNIDIPFYEGNYKKNFDRFGNVSFKELVEKLKILIEVYIGDNKPFQFNIANIYKSEIINVSYSEFNLDTHPCSYNDIVCIKPDGDITVCAAYNLVLANVKYSDSLGFAIKQARSHEFYSLRIRDIKGCGLCRYLKICGGGCRADAQYLFGSNFLPDPINCSIMPLVEEKIIPILSEQEKKIFIDLLDVKGKNPNFYGSFKEVVK